MSEIRFVRSSLIKFFKRYKLQVIVLGIFLGLWAIFFLANPVAYSGSYIYTSLMSTLPFTLIPALALTYVIICGEIDLSFCSIIALSAWVFSAVGISTGSLPLGLLCGLGAGLMAGLLNGVLVTKARIPSLILTIGTMFMWAGVVMVGSQGFSESLMSIKGTTFRQIFVGRVGGVPAQMLWAIAIAFVLWLILSRHRFGAHVYFTGDDIRSARLMGVNVDRVKIICFMLSGIAAAFSGLLISLELLSFWPGMGGGYLMLVIASVVIGGTSIFGGTGGIFGTFIGAHIIGWLETGILAAGISGFWTQLVVGLVIVIALLVQASMRR